MKTMMLAAVALLASPAAAETKATVDVGKADWKKFAAVGEIADRLDYAPLSEMVSNILAKKDCTIARQSANRFDIDVPYAVMMAPDGSISRVLVSDIGCRPIETLVGHAVLARANAGDYVATDKSRTRWYSGTININYN